MSRIFLSHSSANNAEAVGVARLARCEGWDDVFLDLDPERGIAAGERWERALNEAAIRCEAVLFLVSKAWLAFGLVPQGISIWRTTCNKRLFGVLIEDMQVGDLPANLTGTWQVVRLATGRDHAMLRAVLPSTHEEVARHVLGGGIAASQASGWQRPGSIHDIFAWPPQSDPNRPPYRGLRPLEAEDAGIFFGRDAPIVEALDPLRGLREGAPPRLLVILGASGAGKSSFLRAGLFPRLARDDRNFLPLPIIRPERAAITGETGLLRALEGAFAAASMPIPRADLRAVIHGGAATLRPLLQTLVDKASPLGCRCRRQTRAAGAGALDRPGRGAVPRRGAGRSEALSRACFATCSPTTRPPSSRVFTIRSDNYERLQTRRSARRRAPGHAQPVADAARAPMRR